MHRAEQPKALTQTVERGMREDTTDHKYSSTARRVGNLVDASWRMLLNGGGTIDSKRESGIKLALVDIWTFERACPQLSGYSLLKICG